MKAAGPTITYQKLLKLGINPGIIKELALRRSELFAKIRTEFPQIKPAEAGEDDPLKSVSMKSFHCGNHETSFVEVCLPENSVPIDIFVEIEQTMERVCRELRRIDKYKKMWDELVANPKTDQNGIKKKTAARFISRFWQEEENKIILAAEMFFRIKDNRRVFALLFDALFPARKEPFPTPLQDSVLRRLEDYVYEETEYRVTFVEKSLAPTKEDRQRLLGPKVIERIQDKNEKIKYLISRKGQVNGYKRQDDFVLVPHPKIPGVYQRSIQAKDFINDIVEEEHIASLQSFGLSMKELLSWFASESNDRFQLLAHSKLRRNVLSCVNGYLNIDTLLFHTWDTVKEAPLTDWFFEAELEPEDFDQPTPLMDSLVETQLGPRSKCVQCHKMAKVEVSGVKFCLRCVTTEQQPWQNCSLTLADTLLMLCFGRVAYPVGKWDNWQICPFMRGDGNTGKSTCLELSRKMFPAESVKPISSTFEQKFGFEGLVDCRMVQLTDLPENFSKILDQASYQSMVTGEPLATPRKNKVALGDPWKVPIIGAGNYLPNYKDNAGSISRRMAVFPFKNLVGDRDTTLKDTIIEKELLHVLLRSIVLYREVCDEFKGKDFWSKIAPAALVEIQKEVKQVTNSLLSFLQQNGDNYYSITQGDHVTSLNELDNCYSNHMKYTHRKPNMTIGEDHYAIKECGYLIEKLKVCRSCMQRAKAPTKQEKGCCLNYAHDNRTDRLFITNMRIINRTQLPGF